MSKTDDRLLLLFGPYAAPACVVGDVLVCERFGASKVAWLSDAPIPWPVCRGWKGKPRLILCGDLVRAVRRESKTAVAYWWGACPSVVYKWRRALGVPQSNEGSERLYADPVRQKLKQQRRTDLWKPEEDALLGTAPDAEVGRRVGRSAPSVLQRRRVLNIPAFGLEPRRGRVPLP